MSDELNVGKWGMLFSAIKAPKSGKQLLEYVQSNVKTSKDMDYVRDIAYDIGSDTWTAFKGKPGPFSLIDNFLGSEGSYRGQDLGDSRKEDWEPTDLTRYSISEKNRRYGIKDSPDLLSVFLGKTTPESEGLKETSLRPKEYPFADSGSKVYDVNPYTKFRGFKGGEESIESLYEDISKMKHGDVISLSDRKGIEVDTKMSIDVGRINYSIGKDKSGEPYLALADVWDFGGVPGSTETAGGYGDLMDFIGAESLNFYGRFPIEESSYNIINPEDQPFNPLGDLIDYIDSIKNK